MQYAGRVGEEIAELTDLKLRSVEFPSPGPCMVIISASNGGISFISRTLAVCVFYNFIYSGGWSIAYGNAVSCDLVLTCTIMISSHYEFCDTDRLSQVG